LEKPSATAKVAGLVPAAAGGEKISLQDWSDEHDSVRGGFRFTLARYDGGMLESDEKHIKWWRRKPSRGEVLLALFLLAVLVAMVGAMLLVALTMGCRALPADQFSDP
jgi:hypothetical protein